MTKQSRFFPAKLAFCLLCSIAAFGQTSVTILNSDGTITASGGDDLTLPNSALAGISGLGMGYDCPPPACSGTVSLTTGNNMNAGGSLTGMQGATWGSGGSITVVSTSGSGGGFTFMGSFSGATWIKTGSGLSEYWTLIGTISGGTITLKNGDVLNVAAGATIDLTTVHPPKIVGGYNTWTDAGGTTTFPTPAPEPGTLTLVGSGLIGLGFFARRFLARKTIRA